MKPVSALFAAILLFAPASAQSDPAAADIKADMAYLASDRLKGREAGTPEYDMAARYVADRMKQIGLVPKGDHGGYFQHVPLLAYRAKDPGTMVLHDKSGHNVPLIFGRDYVVGADGRTPLLKRDAPLVFVGFGLVAPEHHRDDYAGLDVKGKIVVALSGAPKFLQTEERAYYRSGRTKAAAALAHGAVGFVSVGTLTGERLYPFADYVRQYQSWDMTWVKPDGSPFFAVDLPGMAGISVAGAHKLLGTETDKILAAAETKDGLIKGFALPWSLKAELHTEIKKAESENIVGLLPGNDLIGAEYFAHNPTVPRSAIAADVDLDMPILTYEFTDVTAFGADRSSIGPSVKRAAATMNVKLSPDPEPDEGIFTRSDHYRFVEQGIPAVFLATGFANGGKTATEFFMRNHYHKPSDDLSQPIRYDMGAKFARLNYAITRELADGPRPAWNKGDFFAGKFAGK